MRKMKKINGFLVVRFNDREKAGYPTLGSFGVIDAELYTGSIDVDRDAFEYDDADTIEAAVEQARGLFAETDYSGEPPVYTVIVETAEEIREGEVEPQLLINGWERQLETQIKSPHYKDVDPRTAAHELYGYKAALCDLGLLDREDRAVDPDHFTPGTAEQPLTERAWEEPDAVCENVPSDLQALASPYAAESLTRQSAGFRNAKASIGQSPAARRVYALGLALAQDCPDNDCRVYLNIFKMAQELDAALDSAQGYPALVLRGALHDRLRELSEMYHENYAVQQYRKGMEV